MPSCEWAAGGRGRRRLCTKVTDFYAERPLLPLVATRRREPQKKSANKDFRFPLFSAELSFLNEGREGERVSQSVIPSCSLGPQKERKRLLYTSGRECGQRNYKDPLALLANMKRESL